MVHYQLHSLRRFGGKYKDARVVLTVGADAPIDRVEDQLPWLAAHGVRLRWFISEQHRRHQWYGSVLCRFLHDFQADVVLMLDADVLVTGPLESLVDEIYSHNVVAGVTAHCPPFDSYEKWQHLYHHCGLGTVRVTCEHTGFGSMFHDEARRYCPPYFNFGVIGATRTIAEKIGPELFPLLDKINSFEESFFRTQLALSLAITKLRVPYRQLGMRYNAANDPVLETLHFEELRKARLIHLLRRNELNKFKLFASVRNVGEFLNVQDLRGVNRHAQQILRDVHPMVCQEYRELHEFTTEESIDRAVQP